MSWDRSILLLWAVILSLLFFSNEALSIGGGYSYQYMDKTAISNSVTPGAVIDLYLKLRNTGTTNSSFWGAYGNTTDGCHKVPSFALAPVDDGDNKNRDKVSRFYNSTWDDYYCNDQTLKSQKNRIADIQKCDNYDMNNSNRSQIYPYPQSDGQKMTDCIFRFKVTIPSDTTKSTEKFCVQPLIEGNDWFDASQNENLCWNFQIVSTGAPSVTINQLDYVETNTSSISLTGTSINSTRVICGDNTQAQGTSSWSCTLNNLIPGYNKIKITATGNNGLTSEKYIVVLSLQSLPFSGKVIVVAHQDDEVLGFAGVILNEIRNNHKSVKVIFLTNGKKWNVWACRYWYNRTNIDFGTNIDPAHCPGSATPYREDSGYCEARNSESISALKLLGIPESDILILGCGGSTADELSSPDYLISKLSVIKAQVGTISSIYTHHEEDGNPDHRLVHERVEDAVKELGWSNNTDIYSALIHGINGNDNQDYIWPNPSSAYTIDQAIAGLSIIFPSNFNFCQSSQRTSRLKKDMGLDWPSDIINKPNILPITLSSDFEDIKQLSIEKYTSQIGETLCQLDWHGFLLAFIRNNEQFYKHRVVADETEADYSFVSREPQDVIEAANGQRVNLKLRLMNNGKDWIVSQNGKGEDGTFAIGTSDENGGTDINSDFYDQQTWDAYYYYSDPDISRHNRVADITRCSEGNIKYVNGDNCSFDFWVKVSGDVGDQKTFCVRPLIEGDTDWMRADTVNLCWKFKIIGTTTISSTILKDSLTCVSNNCSSVSSNVRDNSLNGDIQEATPDVDCFLTKQDVAPVNVTVSQVFQPKTFIIISGWNLIGNPFTNSIEFNDDHVSFTPNNGRNMLLSEAGDYIANACWLYKDSTTTLIMPSEATSPDDLPAGTVVQSSIPPLGSCIIRSEVEGVLTIIP